ncbi:MAG: AAA family ATPase [Firmicutes bacterium]|nr:AAA family ATPase [Bacillota bacterium]
MLEKRELHYTELNNICDPSGFEFKTTDELLPLEGIIGQDRAVKAFDFGLRVKSKGYNIYMSGPSGVGKTTYAKLSTQKIAETEKVPYDWCYVYNFDTPRNPQSLRFKPGIGRQFRDDMADLVDIFNAEIPKAFSTEQYEKDKAQLLKSYDDKKEEVMANMSKMAEEFGFSIKTTNSGMYFMPVIDGNTIDEDKYNDLPEDIKGQINANSDAVQENAAVFMRAIKDLEKEAKKANEDLDYKVGMFAIGHYIMSLKEKYSGYERVINYLDDVQEDVLENISQFIEEEVEEEESLAGLIPLMAKKPAEDITLKYRVNLIVDNSKTDGAPVVIDFNPTYYNLVGEIEYDSEFGNLTTDFMKIKPGLFHKANGGYLIVQAQDILSNVQAWEALRRVIKTKEITMETLKEFMGAVVAPTLKPEPIPVNLKVIMIGSGYYYDLLNECDDDFGKFFKIRADFDYEMPRDNDNITEFARFVRGYCAKEELLSFTADAVARVIEYASRQVESKTKISTRFNNVGEILCEASTWASIDGSFVVTGEHVKKAVYEKGYRMRMYEEKLTEMLDEDIIMIDTDGYRVGQINGLAVLDMGSYSFGNPSRITATTYVGTAGIVNIEKEADMSGPTHNKGVQVISGYLGSMFAQEFPLSLSCRICFEQNYNGIDGDSASSTELYAILSSLSGYPINQGLAVTGSVNQMGEIQAIGGVTYKIEGFFDLCNRRGLTGTQGVIIPKSNINDLVLKEEVIEAVKNGVFHIYAIERIEEGIELLTGKEAGVRDENGIFPEGSVNAKVYEKLKNFYESSVAE